MIGDIYRIEIPICLLKDAQTPVSLELDLASSGDIVASMQLLGFQACKVVEKKIGCFDRHQIATPAVLGNFICKVSLCKAWDHTQEYQLARKSQQRSIFPL